MINIRSSFFYAVLTVIMAMFLFITTGCQGCVEKRVKVTENEADIQFDTIAHSFGRIPQGEIREFDFIFYNIGRKPLIIQEVSPTCGCIKENHSVRPIMPGRGGKITAIYDDIFASPGHFHKAIGVASNAKSGYITLIVEGEVVEKN